MSNPTNFEMIQEFHQVFDNGYKDPTIENRKRVLLRGKLMFEELLEVFDELGLFIAPNNEGKLEVWSKINFKSDKIKVAKELADLLYVTYGSADTMNIPMDLVFAEVHRSNMSKLGPDGKPIYREDGKILKGPSYKPVDLSHLVKTGE